MTAGSTKLRLTFSAPACSFSSRRRPARLTLSVPHVRVERRVVCVSIYPPSDETRSFEPVAFLHKPFSLVDLERAIVEALRVARPLAAV